MADKPTAPNRSKSRRLSPVQVSPRPIRPTSPLRNASHEYIIILDADDLLEDFCMSERMKSINQNAGFDMWVFSMYSFREKKTNRISEWIPSSQNMTDRFLSHQLPWTIMQPVWKAEYLKSSGGFDESFVRLQDVELHTRVLLNGAKVCVVAGKPDCGYRVESQRISSGYDVFYNNFASGAIRFFNKFYPLISSAQKKSIALTLLYTIDAIWNAWKCNTLDKSIAKDIVNRMLSETNLKLRDQRSAKLLSDYFRIKSSFRFNIKGLRYYFGKRLAA